MTIIDGVVFGLLGAVSALLFVGVMEAGKSALWPDEIDPDPFSGSWWTVAILGTAGLAVGLVHRFDRRAGEPEVFGALGSGRIDAGMIPGGVLIAMISLVGGFSLGPEVPTGMLAAGVAVILARRLGRSDDRAETGLTASMTGAWGGLFTAPITASLFTIELGIDQRVVAWRRLVSDLVAAVVGFTLFFGIEAGWATTLRLLDLGTYTLELWHVAVAVVLGVVGAIVATVFKLSTVATRRLAAPLKERPVLRGTLAGLVLGVLGVALPLTLFLGTDGLVEVTDDPESIGVGLILLSLVAKLLATSGALSFGFVGGPIFPTLFAGGALGAVVNLWIPDVPAALAVSALMVAVPAAVVPAPLSLATLVALIAGVGPTEAVPVFAAAIVAMVVGQELDAALRRRIPVPAEDEPS